MENMLNVAEIRNLNDSGRSAIRLVLDTNIVMDLLHFHDQRTQLLRAAIDDGRAQCFTDSECLAELERVSAYPAFGLDEMARSALMQRYQDFVTLCEASSEEDYALPLCRDADDQKFLILAARCCASLLLTRDKRLLELAQHRRQPPPYAILTAEAAEHYLQGELVVSQLEKQG
jgi:putative PIN family toxin of toxin-antitoxin system